LCTPSFNVHILIIIIIIIIIIISIFVKRHKVVTAEVMWTTRMLTDIGSRFE